MALELEPFQRKAWAALCGPAPNVLLYGGARSGKTYLTLMWLVLRALAKPKSSHAVFRFRFNHIKPSILETLPIVCAYVAPGQTLYKLNRSDWYAEFLGGSKVYFGGLDDKERTEKILGQEHSTVYLNETSQISYGAFLKVSTRLSQNSGLALKLVCDENPPIVGHWTERLWIRHIEPSTGKLLANPSDYAVEAMNPADNPHIPEAIKERLRNLPPRDRARFWEGKFGEGTESPLWTYESIEAARVDAIPEGVSLSSCLVSIDPSGCHGPEDKRSDEIGMVCGALGSDGVVYVLDDASGRFGPGGEDGWGARGIQRWAQWQADAIIGESNYGGAMVGATVHSARAKVGSAWVEGANVPFREVSASRGKAVRAEPVGTLCDRGRLKFVGHFPELEEQLVKFSTAGYVGEKSPDRADAMVWLAYALGVVAMPGMGVLTWYEEQYGKPAAPRQLSAQMATEPAQFVELVAPMHIAVCSSFASRKGRHYALESGRLQAPPDEVDDLLALGFRRAG